MQFRNVAIYLAYFAKTIYVSKRLPCYYYMNNWSNAVNEINVRNRNIGNRMNSSTAIVDLIWCFTWSQREHLINIGQPQDRNRELLEFLTRRSAADFSRFVNILAKTEQAHLLPLLLTDGGETLCSVSFRLYFLCMVTNQTFFSLSLATLTFYRWFLHIATCPYCCRFQNLTSILTHSISFTPAHYLQLASYTWRRQWRNNFSPLSYTFLFRILPAVRFLLTPSSSSLFPFTFPSSFRLPPLIHLAYQITSSFNVLNVATNSWCF